VLLVRVAAEEDVLRGGDDRSATDPWRMRKSTSEGRFQAKAQSADAAVNISSEPA
jgi:hypothetical protein